MVKKKKAKKQKNTCQRRRLGLDLWVWEILWRRAWQSTPVFLPAESHGQRRMASYSPQGLKIVRHDLVTEQARTSSRQPHFPPRAGRRFVEMNLAQRKEP